MFVLQAVVRNATTQAQVELFEQEMTRMKLKHQLDVKVSSGKYLSLVVRKPVFGVSD